jgi:hypothetical protein
MSKKSRMRRLVISRRNRERFYVGESCIQVEWFPGRGNLIKVTIDAPEDVIVLREELLERRSSDAEDQDLPDRVSTQRNRKQNQNHSRGFGALD